MTTNNAVNVGLSGATGTGNFVGSTSATLVTPTLGAATATSVGFSPTTGGIIGTTTNDNAGSGKVGEFISSNIPFASAVSIPSGVAPVNVTSISLTAGDWDIFGNVTFAANTTGSGTLYAWCGTTSATIPDNSMVATEAQASSANADYGIATPFLRVSIGTTTTVYLSAQWAFFGSATVSASGSIFARRER